LNIRAKGLRQAAADLNTVGHTGINAWGHTDLYSLLVTSTSKLTDWAKNPPAFTPGSVNWGSFAPIVGIPIFSLRLPLQHIITGWLASVLR
jgi:hypothetical protein